MRPADKSYHLFLSYARLDNERPVDAQGRGWVTAFKAELERQHLRFSTRALRIFFDTEAIGEGVDWKRRLGEGLRQSSLLLAFLSPNYLTGENCLWEWEEYLRREHGMARGDDGLVPIYFVERGDLSVNERADLAAWLARMAAKYGLQVRAGPFAADLPARLDAFDADLNRRNSRLRVELHPWLQQGPEILQRLDAAERSQEQKSAPRDPTRDVRSLAARFAELGEHIAHRLNRLLLADLAPGNVARGHEHFVGRHKELSDLHRIMMGGGRERGGRGTGGRGLIAASHGPGGLGKTALARQYAHAYAEYYAAGGTWEIRCESKPTLGQALLGLVDEPFFLAAGKEAGIEFVLTEAQRKDERLVVAAIVAQLQALTQKRIEVLRAQLTHQVPSVDARRERDVANLLTERPRALLILDNVDQPELLSAQQVGLLPASEWLELLVTTRLDPRKLGGGDSTFASVEVDVLPIEDAVDLLRDFQPAHRFSSVAEEAAARSIAAALGGYTLAVELVAAYLGVKAADGYEPSQFLRELEQHGWLVQEARAVGSPEVRLQIRHERGEVGPVLEWSWQRLSAAARSALAFAAQLMPDRIPMWWLEAMVKQLAGADAAAIEWRAVWRELWGLRLLHAADRVEVDARGIERMPSHVRVHRVVAESVVVFDAEAAARWEGVQTFFYELEAVFSRGVGRVDDAGLRAEHPDLLVHLSWLVSRHGNANTPSPRLLSSALVAAQFEGLHGALTRGLELASAVLAGQERVLASAPQSILAQREVVVSLGRLGHFLTERGLPGDLALALQHYQRCCDLSEALQRQDPGSAETARDFNLSLMSLANLQATSGVPGDREQAAKHYQTCHRFFEQALDQDPDSMEAAEYVAAITERLGDFLAQSPVQGDQEQALRCHERSYEISERLYRQNPASAAAARNLSVGLDRLGDARAKRGLPGDSEEALQHYQRSLDVRRQLHLQNPDSAQAASDVAVSLTKLAGLLTQRGLPGDSEQALRHYQHCHKLFEQLLRQNPDAAQALHNVANSHERLAAVASKEPAGWDTALYHQWRALELMLRLHQQNPSSWDAARTAAVSFFLASQYARGANEPELVMQGLAGCHQVLRTADAAGMSLDPWMRSLLEQLRQHFEP